MRKGAHGGPRYGRLGHNTAHDTTKGGHDTADSVRPRGLAGGLCRDTQFCIVTGARAWLDEDGSQYNRVYRDRRVAWPLRRVTIQSLVS